MSNQNLIKSREQKYCADCGNKINQDNGPPEGWELENGRIICNSCCVINTKKMIKLMELMKAFNNTVELLKKEIIVED